MSFILEKSLIDLKAWTFAKHLGLQKVKSLPKLMFIKMKFLKIEVFKLMPYQLMSLKKWSPKLWSQIIEKLKSSTIKIFNK